MTESIHPAGHVTHQVAEQLTQLLHAAQAGQIRGMVFAVAVKGTDQFYCDAAGSLYRDLAKGLGATMVLQRDLLRLVRDVDRDTVF